MGPICSKKAQQKRPPPQKKITICKDKDQIGQGFEFWSLVFYVLTNPNVNWTFGQHIENRDTAPLRLADLSVLIMVGLSNLF